MSPVLVRILALSLLLAFAFNSVMMLVVALVGWNPGTLTLKDLFGAGVFEARGSDWLWILLLWGFALLQSCLLQLPLPVTSVLGGKTPLGPRVLAAAFLGGLFIAIPLLASVDLYYLSADPNGFDERPYIIGALAVWVASWLIWTPILLHRSRGQADAVERFVGKNIAGSAVGLALCLPWYFVLRRKQSCFCGLGTFWALVLGLWSLLVIGGPLLFVLAKDRRIRAGVREG
ncbi:MAG: hypothetical protein CK541_03155 [Opitutia bacterium]|nr:hypothetical protein [Opitutales bacterium]PHX79838.1 MAG: hypothetical protein CK541_03155 [Opitutae bacterium]